MPGNVSIYLCGVTPYDYSHVGHARTCVAMDVLFRYLKHKNYEVNYVRNFTDIDDKIICRANLLGEDPLALSKRFSEEFLHDMSELQCLLPTYQPRVSDHINQVISLILQILRNGCAYVVEGNVYYSIDKFPNYGHLTGMKSEENISGIRVELDKRKQNPKDFVLWKAAKVGEPSWDSPWGAGRPGWHIECSALSSHYLSFSFDIHAGGMDLMVPHHENEIAQNWAACSESNISYWMHIGTVTKNNRKMSKSDGKFITIRDVTKNYHPLALRHFFLRTHYRSTVDYSSSQVDTSSEAVFYIYQTLQDCQDIISKIHGDNRYEGVDMSFGAVELTHSAQNCIDKMHKEFHEKMADDLHTSHVLNVVLPEALKFVNSILNKKKHDILMCQFLMEIEKEIREVLFVLGLLSPFPYSQVLQELKHKALVRAGLVEEDILRFIEERALARKHKDYLRSDRIRDELVRKGITLMDVGNGTIWRPCLPSQH
ncbi:unnamed protein product [Cuscuta campestris]|uniref:cysteine--tRNA ligase n=1 Tax=Cuscuta campestris TaxID=132261 RepID=A0A484N197_9ASTE|nr:unnamed protein product [Cuscuta campestris]